jgi:hypothetical protein
MEGMEGVEGRKVFLAMCSAVGFELNDLVDVFVGTGKGVSGNKSYPIKGRFKGVRVEKGQERFLCRPIVGSQKGRCPSFPPEFCMKLMSKLHTEVVPAQHNTRHKANVRQTDERWKK